MSGKYIGNRPVKMVKSDWKDRKYAEKQNDIDLPT
jgi:hypothetical protein